jgi:hypothetical protein
MATDPITMTVAVYSDPIMVGPGNQGSSGGFKLVDPRSGTIAEVPCDIYGPATSNNDDRCAFSGLGRSASNTTIYAGKRNSPHVVAYDPLANTTVVSAPLSTNPYSAVVGIAVNSIGTEVFALMNEGQHWQLHGGGGPWTFTTASVKVVRLKASDLSVIDQVTLVTRNEPTLGRGISIDAGDTFLAVGVWATNFQRAYRIATSNLNNFTSATLPVTVRVNSVAISNDGSSVYVGYQGGTGAGALTKWSPPAAPTSVDLPGTGTQPKFGRMRFEADGRLYMNMRSGDPQGVYAYNPNDGMFQQIAGQAARSSALSPDGKRLFTIDDQLPATIRVIDIATATVLSATPLENQFSLGRGHFCGEWIEP